MSKKKDVKPENATSEQEKVEDAIVAAEEAAIDDAVEKDESRLAGLTHEELVVECEQAQQKADESHDQLLRLQAEMENMRRRSERDVAGAHKYGSEKLIKELIPVIDGLERGLEIEGEKSDAEKSMHEGMEMTHKLLLEALKKHGVKCIDPAGEPFNPDEMEAISMQPAENLDPNSVITVVQRGYSLNGRLVRAAMVIVSQ
jgi:molecular chaperone GrpE